MINVLKIFLLGNYSTENNESEEVKEFEIGHPHAASNIYIKISYIFLKI